jgi:hypothetical protein
VATRSSSCHGPTGGGGTAAPARAAEHAAGVRVAAMQKKFASSSKPRRG